MSNKIVPQIYRAIIDDVMANIKSEFDDYGVGEDILSDLQSRWENKVIASRVADFEPPAPPPAPASHHYPHVQHSHPSLPQPLHAGYPPPYVQPPPPPSQVKAEPVDGRFPMVQGNLSPYIPALPGPALPGPQLNRSPARPGPPNAGTQVNYTASTSTLNGAARPPYTAAPASNGAQQAPSQPRMPQVDGPSSSSSGSASPPPSQTYAPRASHPSLPQPPQVAGVKAQIDSEEINSDLDDSDTDAEEEDQEGISGDTDIVFCTYDKVARVKNKWKCVLKDGMIHVNNKDYLFAKCTCEFEW